MKMTLPRIAGVLFLTIGLALNSHAEGSAKDTVAAIAKQAALLKTEKKLTEILPLYRAALESPEFQSVPERADLLIALARVHETNRSFVKAGERYAEAFDFAQTTRPNRFVALSGLGSALISQNKFAEARTQFARVSEIPDLTPVEKAKALLNVAKAYEEEGDFAKAKETFQNALKIENLPPGGRMTVLDGLAAFHKDRNDLPAFRETLAAIEAGGGKADLSVLRNYAIVAAQNGDHAAEETAWREMIALKDLPPHALVKPVSSVIDLLAARHDAAGLRKFLAELDGRTLVPAQRGLVTLLTAVLARTGNDWSKFPLPSLEPLDAEQQAATLFGVGKVMMALNDHEAARFLAEKGEGMFPKSVDRVYDVPFLEKAPRGVSGWEASPLLKDPARREARFEEYNKQAAALLINDVNTARKVVEQDTTKKAPVAFYMAADASGWHVYLQYKDDRAEEVLAGLVDGGELEMYVQPGKGECYYQFMIGVPSGKRTFMAWDSPYEHYRKMDDYLVSEVAPIDGGFGIALSIPWELVYDKLPKAGDLWPFGVVDFGRSGAFTWGSGQVHELSRFGKVQFPDIAKVLPALQRGIALKAYGNYQKAAKAAKVTWDDPETGDSEFYRTILVPEMKRLEELGQLAKPAMSEADSRKLFQEAVPTWMEFDYWVADQRTRYLTGKLFGSR